MKYQYKVTETHTYTIDSSLPITRERLRQIVDEKHDTLPCKVDRTGMRQTKPKESLYIPSATYPTDR